MDNGQKASDIQTDNLKKILQPHFYNRVLKIGEMCSLTCYLIFCTLWSRQVNTKLAGMTGLWEQSVEDATRWEAGTVSLDGWFLGTSEILF